MLQMFSATAFLLTHSKALRTGLLKRAIKPHNFSQIFFKTGAKNNQLLTAILISFLGVSRLLGMRGKKAETHYSSKWFLKICMFMVNSHDNLSSVWPCQFWRWWETSSHISMPRGWEGCELHKTLAVTWRNSSR